MYDAVFLYFVFLVCVLLVRPRVGKSVDVSAFEQVCIAHRGFFDNDGESPENSLAAFQKAVDKEYGIELDVQLTSDII